MKKLILLLQLIVCTLVCNAQAPPRWIWLEGSVSGGYGYGDGCQINNDTIFVAGRAAGNLTIANLSINAGGTLPYVGMFDTTGTTNNNGIWLEDNYTVSGFAYMDALAIDHEENSYITSCDESGGGVYIERYNRYGTAKWTTDSPNSNCRGYGVAADNRGNLYSSGNYGGYGGSPITFGTYTLPYGGRAWAGYVTKQDTATGNFKWATYYSSTTGSNNYYVQGGRCAVDNQGNVYVAGTYQGTPTFYSIDSPAYVGPTASAASTVNNFGDLFVAKYDSNGNLVWLQTATDAGAPYNLYGYAAEITVDSCDNVYVAGIFQNTATFGNISVTSKGGYDVYVAKWNALATQWEWVQTAGSTGNDYPGGLTLDKNSDVYFTGTYGSPNFIIGDTTLTSGNVFVAKFANSLGSLIWVANGSSAGPGGVVVDAQKYVYLSGNVNSNGASFGPFNIAAGGNGTFFAKLDTFPVRTIVPNVLATYCPGSTTTLTYTVSGPSFRSGNVFTAQLSNDSGSFINPVFLGQVTSTTSGSITITIPLNTPPGSNYLIRVISSSPAGSSYASGCSSYYTANVYINDFYVTIGSGASIPAVFKTSLPDTICKGTLDTIKISGGNSYLWTYNNSPDSIIVVSPPVDSTYNVIITKGACTLDTSITITVGTTTTANITPQSPLTCAGVGVTIGVPASSSKYTWGPSIGLSATTGDSVIATPTITTVYTINGINSIGCTSTGTDTVFIGTEPPLIVQPAYPTVASTCAGVGITLSVDTTGRGYVWSPALTAKPDTGNTVIATPNENTTYTVTGYDSLGCIVTGYDTVHVQTGPSKPKISHDSADYNILISSATQGNQWERNDTILTGATNQTYTSTIAGYYQVIAKNPVNGCSTVSDSVLITGINQLSISPNQLSIYPNPTGGELFINISSSVTDVKDWNLQITDVLGRTVYTKLSLNYSNDIDLSNLASGVYFITVINKTARAVVPVVKQN